MESDENGSQNEASTGRLVEAIEIFYEAALGYAAQGTPNAQAKGRDGAIRQQLEAALSALEKLPQALSRAAASRPDQSQIEAFGEVALRDLEATRAAFALVLAQPAIGSQLIDNLNASIHVRALLTDLFLIDEALR
jgi:hypothetical protein